MALITRSEAARAMGVTPEAVYAAVKAGRLSTIAGKDGKPLVNSETMREEWAKNTQTRIGMGPKPPGEGAAKKPLRSKEERMAVESEPRISKTKIQGEIKRINKIWIGPIGSKYRRHEVQDQDSRPPRLQDYGSDDLIWGKIYPQVADR